MQGIYITNKNVHIPFEITGVLIPPNNYLMEAHIVVGNHGVLKLTVKIGHTLKYIGFSERKAYYTRVK